MSETLDKQLNKNIVLTERERMQIEYQRGLKHGQLIVYIKNGEPIRLEDIKQSIML